MLSDDEAADLLPQVLLIDAQADDEFDLDIPPTSGSEYLRRVQLEAQMCPPIVVADINSDVYKGKQTVKVTGGSSMQPAPNGYAPSKFWQREQAAMFANVRQSLVRQKAKMRKQDAKPQTPLPLKTDVEGWCKMCFGRLHCVSRDLDESRGTETDRSEGGSQSSAVVTGTPPLLSIMGHMDQPTVVLVLEYHINWFEATGFTKEQGMWFYALLSSLEKPLEPEVCSLLRQFARNCANLRATLDGPHDERLVQLNLLICLVARYFDQSDLADDR